MVTMLYKTTLISVIRCNIRQWISEEVTDMFVVKIDTTQSISTKDQFSVMNNFDSSGTIDERLVCLVKFQEYAGDDFVQHVSKVMLGYNLTSRTVWEIQPMVQQTCREASILA